jgi:hypothetical protein|tara:strand:- start:98 stop:1279 length:1182 start_codon:yes stop_codon:yes gene_type:complete
MNIPIWTGTSIFTSGSGDTPFGFYDGDTEFASDAPKVANFCARRLGYPLVDIELQSGSFFTAFEEAVTTYGNEVYAYKIRDNQLSLDGLPTSSNLNTALITPSFEPIVRLSEQYGEEAGSGGNVTYYSGSFNLTSSVQDYNFSTFMTASDLTGSKYIHGLEVKRVFYQNPYPAGARFLGANNGFGFGGVMAAGVMGLGGFGAEGGYLMAPLNYDIAVIQQIEMSETIRRNQYSFEIRNDNLRVFPIPNFAFGDNNQCKIWFEYILRDERISSAVMQTPGNVTNVSNAPYANPDYNSINSVGRQWIFEYTLALSKEMLGYVRGKYGSIPIPNADVVLNQSDLIAAATAEKTTLIERLRTYLDETSRMASLERRAQEGESKMMELQKVPYTIYIA